MATARQQESEAAQPTAAERKLAKALRARMADSLLPGDKELSSAGLDEAAAFLLEAARHRAEGEASVLVWDPLESTCRHASLSIL